MNRISREMLVFKTKFSIKVWKYRKTLHLAGLITLVYETCLTYTTFLMAYFHDSKSVLVKVDAVNEANFEFVVVPILVLFGIWAVIDIMLKRGKEDLFEI